MTAAVFGKRGSAGAVQRVGRQPRLQSRKVGALAHSRKAALQSASTNQAVPEPTRRASALQSTAAESSEILRLERTWWDGTIGVVLLLLGVFVVKVDEPGWFVLAMGLLCAVGGLMMIADHLSGKPKLVVDEHGFRNEGVLINRKMAWEDLEAFQITTVNWVTTVNAKAAKHRGPTSNKYVNVPNSAFKMKSLAFVTELLSRRPDMADAVLDVMKRVGAKKLIQQL